MKKLFQTSIGDKNILHFWILVLRVFTGIAMMTHGLPKMQKLFAGGDIQFADPIGLGPAFSLGLTVFSEVICSALIIIGLFTRLAVIPLIITFLVIVFIVHGNDGFGDKELPIMYLVIFVTLLFTGSGKFSADNMIK